MTGSGQQSYEYNEHTCEVNRILHSCRTVTYNNFIVWVLSRATLLCC